MNRNKKVGYTYYGKGGARHTGITNNPKRRRTEHNKATGGDGFLKVQTGPMSKANAKRWESGQRTTRGYAISQRTLRDAKRRLPRARRDGGLFRMRRHPLHVGLTVTSSSALT